MGSGPGGIVTSESSSEDESPSPRRMVEWAGPVLGGLALVVAVAGLASNWRTTGRLTQLEQRVEATAQAPKARSSAAPEKRRSRRRPDARRPKASARDRPTPEQRQQRLREEVTAHVESFATDHELDEPTVAGVLGELEARNEAVRAVFQDLSGGVVSAEQAREEVQWVRDDSANRLREILGDELYDELDRHLSNRSSRRRRAATSRALSNRAEGAR